MQFFGRTQMIRSAATYEEAVKRIAECGFDGAEINIYDRQFQICDAFFREGFAPSMKECLQKNHLLSYSVGAHLDYTNNQQNFELLQKAIRITKDLGADIMLITGGVRTEEEPFLDQWNRQIHRLKVLCSLAEENGVKLAVEFEPPFIFYNTQLVLQAIEEIGSPALKINADIGHMFLQDPDPLEAIRQSKELIVHGHVENMAQGIHNHLLPWEGDMDLAAYAKQFKDIGFEGPMSLDVYQYDYEAVAGECLAFLRKIFGKVVL